MSRRDLAHVLTALAALSGERAGVGVAVADIDEAIGRHGHDMRTPLNLADLAADGRVARLGDGTWALTAAGLEWIAQDRELSDR
jgi:hypothetical protein